MPSAPSVERRVGRRLSIERGDFGCELAKPTLKLHVERVQKEAIMGPFTVSELTSMVSAGLAAIAAIFSAVSLYLSRKTAREQRAADSFKKFLEPDGRFSTEVSTGRTKLQALFRLTENTRRLGSGLGTVGNVNPLTCALPVLIATRPTIKTSGGGTGA